MTSLTAGSPKCNCKNPDTCVHSFKLNIDKKTYEYKQNDFYSHIVVINKTDKPIPLTLSLTGKTCVSNNPKCPNGIIYNIDSEETLKKFTSGTVNYEVNYNEKAINNLSSINTITFISKYILYQNSALNWLPKSQYILRVGQCYGDPLVERKINFSDGFRQIFNIAPHDRIWSYINVYPGYDWKIDVKIGLTDKTNEYSDDELKDQQRKENRKAGQENRGVKGWTKRPKYSITDALDIDGTMSYKLGSSPRHDLSQKLKVDFKRKAKELTLLQDTTRALDLVGKALSTNEGAGTKYKILNTDILYPKLAIGGSGELVEDNNTQSVYIKGKVSAGFSPLIGLRITFDLLQAFAAWYGAASVTDVIRQQLAARENSVKRGNNGAYLGLKFDLIASGTVYLAIIFESNAKGNWNWRVDGSNEVKLTLSLEANARAGVKISVFEGAFEVYAKAIAEGIIAFDSTAQSNIEMIFYHNGIRAEVGASISAGIAKDGDKPRNGENGRVSTKTTDVMTKRTEGQKKEWIIHGKLEKNKSTYRFRLL
ncbi:hypothetical protein E2M46_16310 [Salmonella enterica subsp. enterica serovar Othmarschen]|nr:hypothetical protein [Salmonella enterica subsp. enterica]ECD6357078.1 hypothetical protein [Salmonella enterica subsp. enterica serovar Othmarschen]